MREKKRPIQVKLKNNTELSLPSLKIGNIHIYLFSMFLQPHKVQNLFKQHRQRPAADSEHQKCELVLVSFPRIFSLLIGSPIVILRCSD